MRLLALAALLALLTAAPTSAQAFRSFPPPGASVSLEVLKPFLGASDVWDREGRVVGEARPSALHSAQVLSARVPLGRRVTLVGAVPFGYSAYEYGASAREAFPDAGRRPRFGPGNPFIGADVVLAEGVDVGGGVWLPLLPSISERGSSVSLVGLAASSEQPEAFLQSTASAVVHGSARREVGGGVRLSGVISPVLRLGTRSWEGWTPEFSRPGRVSGAVAYGAFADRALGRVRVEGGVTQQGVVFAARNTFRPPLTTLLAFGAELEGAAVRPALRVHVPVQGFFTPDAVVGIGLTVPVR